MKQKNKLKFKKGCRYKTRGGWEAEVIADGGDHYYCVHFVPEDILAKKDLRFSMDEMSCPIWHGFDGKAGAIMTIHDPPTYYGHPADLVSEVKNDKAKK